MEPGFWFDTIHGCGLTLARETAGPNTEAFRGHPLKAILEKYNVSVDPQVKFVTVEGHDLPMGLERPDFEHSLPAAPVLEGSIFALKLNGESLPGIHGGPVRLVTPGLFGTMRVKWLRRLRFETAESPNFYHGTEYRVPDALLKPGESSDSRWRTADRPGTFA